MQHWVVVSRDIDSRYQLAYSKASNGCTLRTGSGAGAATAACENYAPDHVSGGAPLFHKEHAYCSKQAWCDALHNLRQPSSPDAPAAIANLAGELINRSVLQYVSGNAAPAYRIGSRSAQDYQAMMCP